MGIKSGDKVSKSIIEKATVSKSADTRGCLFSCSKCSTTVTSWVGLRKHLKKSHNAALLLSDVDNCITQAIVHKCNICSDKILCDSAFLHEHMTHKHSITITEYRRKYVCDVAWKSQQRELLENGRLSENKIGNLCTYKCSQCKRKFETFKSLAYHGPRCEKGPLKIRRHDIGKYIIHAVSHKCKLCSTLLFCDIGVMREHMAYSHEIKSIKEYALKVGCKLVQNKKET